MGASSSNLKQINLNSNQQSGSSSSSSSPSPLATSTSAQIVNSSTSMNRTTQQQQQNTAISPPINGAPLQNGAVVDSVQMTNSLIMSSNAAAVYQRQNNTPITNMPVLTNSAVGLLVDSEKERLKQELIKQTEMSNKLETLCLQYRNVNHLN